MEPVEAATTSLREIFEAQREHADRLVQIQESFLPSLRFQVATKGGEAAVEATVFATGVDQLRPLHEHFHVSLQENLDRLLNSSTRRNELSPHTLNPIANMNKVLQAVYAPLRARQERIISALQDSGYEFIQTYCKRHDETIESLVKGAFGYFDRLQTALQELRSNVTKHATSHFIKELHENAIQHVKTARGALDEMDDIVSLHTRLEADEVDLCGRRSKLSSTVKYQTCQLDEDAKTLLPYLTTKNMCEREIHLLDDGRCLLSEVTDDKKLQIVRSIQLKEDAVVLETIPESISSSVLSSTYAIALFLQEESIMLSFPDATSHQSAISIIDQFLQEDESTRKALARRSIDESGLTNLSSIAKEQLQDAVDVTSDHPTLVSFSSFHSDALPGLFWIEKNDQWVPVEVALGACRFLLIFQLGGWGHHVHLLTVDLQDPEADVQDMWNEPFGDFSLHIKCSIDQDEKQNVIVKSQVRSRIDYWCDEVSRVVDEARAAAKVVEDVRDITVAAANRSSTVEAIASDGDSDETMIQEDETNDRAKDVKVKRKSEALTGNIPEQAVDLMALAMPSSTETETVSKSRKRLRQHSPSASPKKQKVESSVSQPTEMTKLDARAPSPAVMSTTSSVSIQPGQPNITLSQVSSVATEEPPRSQPSASRSTSDAVRIILTGMELSAGVKKQIKAIEGGVYEDDVEKATHLVAPKDTLKRTVKMLCGISCCKHIVDEQWLVDSAEAGKAVDEEAYCLRDASAESKWEFQLSQTMYEHTLEQRQQLFAGHHFFITNHKSILPPVKELKRIVECAGGEAETKGSAKEGDIVITTEAALATVTAQKAVAKVDKNRLYSPELVLRSILQQQVDLESYHVEASDTSTRRRSVGSAKGTPKGKRKSPSKRR